MPVSATIPPFPTRKPFREAAYGGGWAEVQAAHIRPVSLIVPDRRLHLPQAAHLRPHRDYLSHHRARFKG